MKTTLFFAAALLVTALVSGTAAAETPSTADLLFVQNEAPVEGAAVEPSLPELLPEVNEVDSITNQCVTNCLRKLNICLANCGSNTTCQATCQSNFFSCVC